MNTFFNILPFFASYEFFILIVAIGYWISRNKRIFIELTFLVPFTTIVNCLLKNIFSPEQNNITTYPVWVHDMVGFPSGDAQMSSVFWCMLAINYRSKYFQIFSIIMIVLIGISRVYLQVHSVIDVIGGIGFGILTIILWYKDYVVKSVDMCIKGQTVRFWGLITLTTILFESVSLNSPTPPVVALALGLLTGLGIFLQTSKNPEQNYNNGWLGVALSLIIFIIYTIYIPIIHFNTITTWISIIIKYGFITYSAGVIFPKFQTYVHTKLRSIELG